MIPFLPRHFIHISYNLDMIINHYSIHFWVCQKCIWYKMSVSKVNQTKVTNFDRLKSVSKFSQITYLHNKVLCSDSSTYVTTYCFWNPFWKCHVSTYFFVMSETRRLKITLCAMVIIWWLMNYKEALEIFWFSLQPVGMQNLVGILKEFCHFQKIFRGLYWWEREIAFGTLISESVLFLFPVLLNWLCFVSYF